MSFKEFVYPLTFWYYDKDLSLTDRAIAGFFSDPVTSYCSCYFSF